MNIPLGIDLPLLQSDLSKASAAIKGSTERFAQDADAANKKIKEGTEGTAKAFGSLQQQFRAAQKEALNLGQKYGLTSQAATEAFKKAGELKDQIADSKVIIDAFAADSKFTAVAGALRQAAGAASIVTGTMGLLGTQSEETQKMLLKVQSALALTQGLAQLKEMGAAFTALSAVIRADVIPSILAMDAAMSATLIGAIAVATIAIIGIANDMGEAADSAQKLADKNKVVEDSYKNLSDAVKAAAEANAKTRDIEIQGMAEGQEKDRATLDLKIQNMNREAKERFNTSNQTIYDSRRLAKEQIAIEKLKAKELSDIRKKYTVVPKMAVANQLTTLGEDTGLSSSAKRLQDQVNKTISGIKVDPLIKVSPQVEYESSWAFLLSEKMKKDLDALNAAIKTAIAGGVAQTIVSMGTTIADAAIGAYKDPFEAIGQMFLQSLGNLMVQMGSLMITFGISKLAFIESIKSLNPGGAAIAIGAGLAMVAAGAAISKLASNGLQRNSAGGGGGGASPSVSAPDFRPSSGSGSTSGQGTITDRIYGGDLLLIIDQAGRVRRR